MKTPNCAQLDSLLTMAPGEAFQDRDSWRKLAYWAEEQYWSVKAKCDQLEAQLIKVNADYDELAAEYDDASEQIERICKELGDADVLISQGPIDGVTKLINQRDELREKYNKTVNPMMDLVASGGLPEAQSGERKSYEELLRDKDFIWQVNIKLKAERDELAAALKTLLIDVQDYPAWERPCHAVNVARAALAKLEDQ